MREKSVETFQLTIGNCFEFFVYICVPSYFMYSLGVGELKLRDRDRGCYREYGMLPPSPQTFRALNDAPDAAPAAE